MAGTLGSQSKFLALPAEIRLAIYKTLCRGTTLYLPCKWDCGPLGYWGHNATPHIIATCRKIRDEAIPVLSAAILLNVDGSPVCADAVGKVPAYYCASITKLTVEHRFRYGYPDIAGLLPLLPSLQVMTIDSLSWPRTLYESDLSLILSEAGDSFIMDRAKDEIEIYIPEIQDMVFRTNHRIKLNMILTLKHCMIRYPDKPWACDLNLVSAMDSMVKLDGTKS